VRRAQGCRGDKGVALSGGQFVHVHDAVEMVGLVFCQGKQSLRLRI
jgi:hypothetical protein